MFRRMYRALLCALFLLTASGVKADQVVLCPAQVYYYVFFTPPPGEITYPSSTLQNYINAKLKFTGEVAVLGAGAPEHWRTVNERSTWIVQGVCSGDVPAFEAATGILRSAPVDADGVPCRPFQSGCSNELFAVFDGGGNRLGSKWQDTDTDFSEEGGVATQNYFYCENPEDGGPKLLVANAAAFHSGLSREGINATEAAKELNWFAPVRRALREVTGHHIRAFSREKKGFCPCGLTEITKSEFILRAKSLGKEYRVHYDVYDPQYGECGDPAKRCEPQH